MKLPRMATAMHHIDPALIADAATAQPIKKHHPWRIVGSIAACLAIAIAASAALLPRLLTDTVTIGGLERSYKSNFSTVNESAIIWPWSYQTPSEQYTDFTLGSHKYSSRGREIGAELIERELGIGTGEGYDIYEEQAHTANFPAYQIKHVSENRLIAVLMDGTYYVYVNQDAGVPATLGDLIDDYCLPQTLPLSYYTVYGKNHKKEGHFTAEHGDIVWEMLANCRDAVAIMDNETRYFKENGYISFTATSEALGVYKRVFYIVEEGYVWTNICDYAAAYEIGPEAAAAIIAAVRKDETPAEPEPYQTMLCGTITEIGEDYLLLDDSVMCIHPADGMVFRIPLDNVRARRCIEFPGGRIQVGSTVAVYFEGELTLGEDNTVRGAVSIAEGQLTGDGNMLIPE